MMNEERYKIAAIVLLCTTIAATAYAVNSNYKYDQMRENFQYLTEEMEDYTILVDLKVDYGNGSVEWYNDTRIQVGATLFDLSQETLEISYDEYEFGVFVTSINGHEADDSHYWSWSYYEEGEWQMGQVGADHYTLKDGYLVSWIYTGF